MSVVCTCGVRACVCACVRACATSKRSSERVSVCVCESFDSYIYYMRAKKQREREKPVGCWFVVAIA